MTGIGSVINVTAIICGGLLGLNFGYLLKARVLIALTSELAKSFGQDMSFRFGGDEFLAIALDERLDKVQAKSDQILSNLKKQCYHVSIGIK